MSTRVNPQESSKKELSSWNSTLLHELAALRRLTPRELCARYAEAFGEQPSTKNRGWLLKRIAWRLQALAEGDLSQRARQRAAELANVDADLRNSPRPGPPAPTRLRPSLPRRRRHRRAHPRTAACPRPAPS